MNPNIGKRAGINKSQAKKKPCAVRDFVRINTHNNITMKREYMYLEDVKEAVNINTLETRINLLEWLKKTIQENHSKDDLVKVLEDLVDKDRHYLQKNYKITLNS